MKLLDQSEVKIILTPHMDSLNNVLQLAFDRYHNLNDKHEHTPRSRASLIHDFIVINAEKEFSNITGLECGYTRGLFTVSFYDKVIIRFKKLDYRMKASNIPTQQALCFETQEQLPLPSFPLLPSPTIVTAGYIPNPTWTEINQKVITCYKDKEILWTIPIAHSTKSVIVPLFEQKSDLNTLKSNRWKPKHLEEKEGNNESASK